MRGRRAPPRWLSRPQGGSGPSSGGPVPLQGGPSTPKGAQTPPRGLSPPQKWPRHRQRGSDPPQVAHTPHRGAQIPHQAAQSPSKVAQTPPNRLRHPQRRLSPSPKWPRHPLMWLRYPPRGLSLPFTCLRSPPQVAPHLLLSPYFFPLERMRGKSPQQWAPNVEAAPQGAAQVHFVAPHFLQRSSLAFLAWCGPGAPQRSRAAMLQAALHLVRPPGITPNHYTTTRGFNSNTTVIP